MLASLANGEKILLKVQSHLAWFKHYSPVIVALLSPALKRRHLDQLRTKGIFLNLAEHTVSKLVERKVFLDLSEPSIQDKGFSHRAKLILEVIEHAQKSTILSFRLERLKQSGRQFLLNLKFCQEIATKATQHFIPHTEQMYTMCRPCIHFRLQRPRFWMNMAASFA